ncbi:ATP-binding protein [Paracoccus saliphilus]|uniref:Signal transduction histidine-protein kinase/phosphatase MprB n=1 Tax=Paracoccus saliphilus TaxID=405559 RepID=A0AA45W807_9RHOB|nr:sensor histidine kinase [Paracoccus saliphilus]WCR04828.1 sensor histidine kinase [Paracoccus saliphilus]SIT13057.1 Signal transduction histidine kinase [Paracoccus saliphilus]
MGPFLYLPLSLRVPLLAAVLMILVGVIASHQVLSTLDRVQDNRLRELARLHIEGLSLALGPSVLRKDIWEVYDTLDRASSTGSSRRMLLTVVADETGKVLAATDPRRVPIDTSIDALAEEAQRLDAITFARNSSHVRVRAPLVYQGRDVGKIVADLDVRDMSAERRRAELLLIIGNTLLTTAMALAGYLAVRRMLRPVTQLARRMDATIGQPIPIPAVQVPRGDSEVARLFQTYNAMAEAIEARSEAERQLAERERFVSLGQLSSSLAHEINNPLGGLINATDTIRRFADRPDVVRQSAELLERGLKHLRDVTHATLEQNRIDQDGADMSLDDLADLRLLIGPEITRHEQRLDWRIELDPKNLSGHDAGMLRQILLNLLLNASNAAKHGGKVGLHAYLAGDALRFEIFDNGPGMPAPALRRLQGSEPILPGEGVGLRMVRELVGMLAGTITHLAPPDGGTRIIISLPCNPPTPASQSC